MPAQAKWSSRGLRGMERSRPAQIAICGKPWHRLARSLLARLRPQTIPALRRIPGLSANLELAWKRADAVRRELVALGAQRYAKDVQVEGFGKVLPVACNETELGRQKNRRVEVFLGR